MTYKVALYCYNCKSSWTIEVDKGNKIFEHSFGSTITSDNNHWVDYLLYKDSIICPECGCKSGVKKA